LGVLEFMKTYQSNNCNLLSLKQREFVSFVLRNYLSDGVDELDVEKLSTA